MAESKEWKLDERMGLHCIGKCGDQYWVDLDGELDLEVNIEPRGYGESNQTVYVRMSELQRLFELRGYEIRRKGD